jgi:hypothetical protein
LVNIFLSEHCGQVTGPHRVWSEEQGHWRRHDLPLTGKVHGYNPSPSSTLPASPYASSRWYHRRLVRRTVS